MFVEHYVGAFVAGFGLTAVGVGGSNIATNDVMFLVVGGMLFCLIGAISLAGFMRWVHDYAQKRKVVFNVRQRTDQSAINGDTGLASTRSFTPLTRTSSCFIQLQSFS